MSRVPYIFTALLLAACADVPPDEDAPEIITTLTLTFTPDGGGAPLEFVATDPKNDGNLVIDDIELSDAENYTLDVGFYNDVADEDVTVEVEEEGDQHQVFFTGSAVAGPASASTTAVVTQAYADTDAGGLPIGLTNTITTDAEGKGELVVTLRHLPPENGVAVKVAGLAELVASEGFGAIAGERDAEAAFSLTVVP